MSALPEMSSLSNVDYGYAEKLYFSLKSYWLSLYSEGDCIPLRKQFSPAKVRSLIPNLYMLEWIDGGQIKVRHRGTGIEQATGSRFLAGAHLKNNSAAEWAQMERYFDTIFSVPCSAEGDWRYYTKEGEVYDAVTYSMPLYGQDDSQRIALGIMVLRRNFDQDLVDKCDGVDRADILHAVYKDMGFGVQEGVPVIVGR